VDRVICTATKISYENPRLHLNAHMFSLLGFEVHCEAIGDDYSKHQRDELADRFACCLGLITGDRATLRRLSAALLLLHPQALAASTT